MSMKTHRRTTRHTPDTSKAYTIKQFSHARHSAQPYKSAGHPAERTRGGDGPVSSVREAAVHLLQLSDRSVVDVVLATVIANELEGDPLWLVLVSPPSNGKTEILISATRTPKTFLLSTLTKNTLVSGQRPTEPGDLPEPSLLPRLTDRTLILKDFTTILGLHRDERNAILGLLREIYDGKVVKPFGTGKVFQWEGKVGLLAGVTPIFDRHSAVQSILGERFLLYRLPGGDREERRAQAQRALDASGHEKTLREALGDAMLQSHQDSHAWHDQHRGRIIIPDMIEEALISLADLAAYGRAGVLRDGYDRQVKYLPEPEGPARLVKQLRQLAMGLCIIHGRLEPGEEELATLRKVARDTMHPFKARVLAALAKQNHSTATLAKATGLTYAMVEREMEDCVLLGLVTGDAKQWCLVPGCRRDIETSGIFMTTRSPLALLPKRTPPGG